MQITPLQADGDTSAGGGFSSGGFGLNIVLDTCVEGDILANYPPQNLGTSQFAGPAETAYSVPQPTVEHESIGVTPCGGTLRKVITKTYASRSVADQWKVRRGWFNGQPYNTPVTPAFTMYITTYGATAALADGAQLNAVQPYIPETCVVEGYTGTLPLTQVPSQNTPYFRHYIPALSGSPWATYYAPVAAKTLYAGITIYYLDITEAWSYEIV